MNFLLSDTFTDSLARLTGDEQKLIKTTVFDLQVNPSNPGHSFHKLDGARDKNFWSVRVGSDLRLIVHRQEGSLLVCYVDHHDKAYHWAERRKLETHPKTGAAQLVEIRETVKEIVVQKVVEASKPIPAKPRLFAHLNADDILGVGVPPEWVADVLEANEDLLLELTDHLPREASEALLELATGSKPKPVAPAPAVHPFEHPDAQRRFRVMKNVEELEQALEFPWDKWTIFLHPAQRQMIEKEYSGPARVSGSAGTGKTIVALHRAVHLVQKFPESRVLLTTFSEALADALRIRVRRLISSKPLLGERLEVHALDAIALRLYETHVGKPILATKDQILSALSKSLVQSEVTLKRPFLFSEWTEVVDAWQLKTWESYRDVPRLGRKSRLKESVRQALWALFAQTQRDLAAQGLVTLQEVYGTLADRLNGIKHPPFEYVVVDEAQDIGPTQLRFLAALGAGRANGLFFAGDLGQRIFQQPFSWKSMGVEVRGRSRTLKINYRTSHQIRAQADLLLGPDVSDVDGNVEERKGTVSAFNGPAPIVRDFPSQELEISAVAEWLSGHLKAGVVPSEIGVFVRSPAELPRAQKALEMAGIPFKTLEDKVFAVSGFATASTMHLAKGLEFKLVAVMACDDQVIPLQSRIEAITDDSDLEEVYNTERHLLYVACTRARDQLMVSAAENASEFLADLRLSERR